MLSGFPRKTIPKSKKKKGNFEKKKERNLLWGGVVWEVPHGPRVRTIRGSPRTERQGPPRLVERPATVDTNETKVTEVKGTGANLKMLPIYPVYISRNRTVFAATTAAITFPSPTTPHHQTTSAAEAAAVTTATAPPTSSTADDCCSCW